MNKNDCTKISRSKLELFLECKRCFYLYVKFGINRPGGYGFSLNQAVDLLLKKDFDFYRKKHQRHPIFIKEKLNIFPYHSQSSIDRWRKRDGLKYSFTDKNITITGLIDDVLICYESNELFVMEYKATSKKRILDKSLLLNE